MFGRFAVGVVSLLGAGCGDAQPPPDERARSLQAGVSGTVDDSGTFSGVVGVVARKGDLVARCTGTMIAEDLLLTARHCVAFDDGELVTCGQASLGASVGADNVLVTALPEQTDVIDDYVTVAEIIPAPGGDDTCGFDLAALRLASPPLGGTTVYPPRIDVPVSPGEPFTAVGYGSDGTTGIGTRRYQENASAACVGEQCAMPEVQESEWLAEDGAFCRADSGGAAIDAEGRLIGTISRGQDPCTTPILAAMPSWKDWLVEIAPSAAWASEPTPTPAMADGEPLKSTCSFAAPARGSSTPYWLVLSGLVVRRLLGRRRFAGILRATA